MGEKSREVEDIEAQMYILENRLKTAQSHMVSIEIMRKLEELKKRKEDLDNGKGWIIG